jgi:drug/metabolite transporter (DMT)-like permease
MLGGVPAWLPLSLLALVVWAVQRLLSKLALTDLGTGKFYLLSAAVSLVTYAPFLAARPPVPADLPPALGLACLMALTFGVTTEAIRRGPLGAVSPITALSPVLTATLALTLLGERLTWPAYLGVTLATSGIVLLSWRRRATGGEPRWLWLAVLSLTLQGIGAFVAKLVVTPAGPSGLLLTSAGVQVLVGLVMAPPWRWRPADLLRRAAMYTLVAYATAGVATIGYLSALAAGPAAVVVPLVATSPALAGLLGLVFLDEPASWPRLTGIALAVAGAVLLAGAG